MSAGEDEFSLANDLSGVIEQEFFRLNDTINPQDDSFPAPYYGQLESVSTKEVDKSPTTSTSPKENNSGSKDEFATVKKSDSDSDEGSRGQKRAAVAIPTKSENTGTFRTEETGTFGSSDEPCEGDTGEASSGANSTRSSKKPRLVWTAELHSRFMNAVNHLGVKNAVPKTILQLMNVEGMTRENVASHLQKYRLYLKRCAGLPPSARLSNDATHSGMTGSATHAQMYHPHTYVTPTVVLPSQHMSMAPSMVQQGQPMHPMVQSYMPPAPGGVYATDMPGMFTGHATPVPSATAMGLPYRNRMDSNPCYYSPYMPPPRMVSNYAHSTLEPNPSLSQPYYGYAQPSMPASQPAALRDQTWDGYSKPMYRPGNDTTALSMHPQQHQHPHHDARVFNRVSSMPTSAVMASSYPPTVVEGGSQYRPMAAIGSPVSDPMNGSTLSQTSQNTNMGLTLGYSGEQSLSQSPQQYTWSGETSVGTYSQPSQVAWNGEDWSKQKYMDDSQASGSLKHW